MTSKEFIEQRIISDKEALKNAKEIKAERLIELCQSEIKQYENILKDLEMLEELKNPYDEYENENFLCTREAYYNENIGELCFAYTIYEWKGDYIERDIPILKKKQKFKKWVEVFHTGTSTGKKELNDEYIQDYLKLKEIMKKEVVKK